MRARKPPGRGARVIILARFSSDLQNPLSADDQILRCREECEKNGWIVVGEYKDEAKSGRSVLKRSGYIAAMAAAIAGKCDLIMVTALDRLGRNARELNDARYRLSDHDVEIYTLAQGILGSFEFAVWAEFAQTESENIGRRVRDGQRAAAARGKVMGDAAYGYQLVDTGEINPKTKRMIRRIEVDPITSKVVVRIHEDYNAGVSPVAIAAALTREGVPTPQGGSDWHPNTILGVKRYRNGVLRNPIYVGLDKFGKTFVTLDPRTGKSIKTEAGEDNFVVTEHPDLAIVPRELWDKNQARLESRSFELPNRNRGADYLLSGLMSCAECGRSYVMVSRKLGCSGRKIHACDNGRRVDRVAVERVVLDGLGERLGREDIIQWFLPEYLVEAERAASELVDRRAQAGQRLEVVQREIDALVKQARAGAEGYAAKILNEELEARGAERERLTRELKASPPPAPPPTSPADVADRLRRLVDDLEVELVGPERDAQRATDLIRSIITEVLIKPIEPEGRPDGRGAGPVRVTVTGKIDRLVDVALLDRQILHDTQCGGRAGSFDRRVHLLRRHPARDRAW